MIDAAETPLIAPQYRYRHSTHSPYPVCTPVATSSYTSLGHRYTPEQRRTLVRLLLRLASLPDIDSQAQGSFYGSIADLVGVRHFLYFIYFFAVILVSRKSLRC